MAAQAAAGGGAAVPPVKYHTSDFLAQRHPFQPAHSFETQRQRDSGKVLHGLYPRSIDGLVSSLTDASLEPMQRAIALKHLLAHSAAAEKKILFLRDGIVPTLASLFHTPASTPNVEATAALVLRSLAVLPQGAHCVVVEGGLEGLVACIRNRKDLQAREEARLAAVEAILMIATCWDGREWLLGLDGAEGMQFPDRVAPTLTPEQRDSLARDACDALSGVLDADAGSPRLIKAALHAVALITSVPKGLQLCLIAGALRAAAPILQRYCEGDANATEAWASPSSANHATDVAIVTHAVTVVYHIAMDEVGKREAMELPIVKQLTQLTAQVMTTADGLFELKAVIAGCSCALALYVPWKSLTLEAHPVGGHAISYLDMLTRLLQHANRIYEPTMEARKRNEPPPFETVRLQDVQAVIKGCVQAIRLLCELPAARQAMHTIVTDYNLRRQIFYATPFQAEFGVRPV